jgi:hypothetical protein
MSDVAWDRGRNPYAPIRRAGEDEPAAPRRGVLPVLRLRRLGGSQRLLDGMATLWASMDDEGREAMADEMAALDDGELMARLVGEPPDGDVDEVAAWIDAHPFPPDAAKAAIAVERAGPEPSLAAIDRYARTGAE